MPDRPIPKMLRPLRDVGDTTQDVGYRLVMAREARLVALLREARGFVDECAGRLIGNRERSAGDLLRRIDAEIGELKKKDDPWRGSEEA